MAADQRRQQDTNGKQMISTASTEDVQDQDASTPDTTTSINERLACTSLIPGFHYRPPPPPHELTSFITPEHSLFQTIHMAKPIIDPTRYLLKIHGLVQQPYTLTYEQLTSLPGATTLTSFHECYGSPLVPPTANPLRIGNVTWKGVPLRNLLHRARLLPDAAYIWTAGLDSGSFGGYEAPSYEKDLPLAKAVSGEVLVAWEMNGERLGWERGGPVRLVVPGWFGTNSTKWLCGVEVRRGRGEGVFTTRFYNEVGGEGARVPVWEVGVNSVITRPRDGEVLGVGGGKEDGEVEVEGWAWSGVGVKRVEVSVDGGESWCEAEVVGRKQFEWQKFVAKARVYVGTHRIMARAMSINGHVQPLSGKRNHVHSIQVEITTRS